MDGMGRIHKLERDRQLLVRLKDNLIDLDIVVDDARDELHRALEQFQAAVAARDAEARALADLMQRIAA